MEVASLSQTYLEKIKPAGIVRAATRGKDPDGTGMMPFVQYQSIVYICEWTYRISIKFYILKYSGACAFEIIKINMLNKD